MLRNPGLRKSVEQPVLDLNFAASQIGSNAAPDSRIDFSRGSNAWFVDSDGLVKKSPHNLSLYSEDFTQWNINAGVVTANQIAAPDGSLTADLLADDGTTGNHRFSRLISGNTIGETMFASLYVKATSDNTTILWREDKEDALFVGFNPTTGQITSGTGTAEDVGNGWYRLTITGALASQTVWSPEIRFSGTPASVYVWGAQLSQHTTLPVDNRYVKTEGSAVYAARLDHDPTWFMSAAQEQNLLEYSEMLDDSGWTKNSVSVTANAETDPLGGTTAEYIFATSPSGDFPSIQGSFDTKKGAVHTVSFYAKAGEIDVVSVGIRTSSGGYVSDPFSNQALTSEWQRFSGTFTATEDTHLVRFFFGSGAKTWTGDQGFYIWGTQIEVGSTASTYHRTEGAPYYGEGATPKGLLIEEARTNLITDSEDFSAASWSLNPAANLQVNTNQVLAPDGTTTADELEVTGTPSAAVYKINDAVNLTSGQTYIGSVFGKKSEQRYLVLAWEGAALSGQVKGGVDLETGNIITGSDASTTVEDYGNGWYRVSLSATATSSGSAACSICINDADDVTVSHTPTAGDSIYIWGAQIEQGSFPTSYIQTTGTTLTRDADVAVMGPTTGGTELVTNGTFDTDVSNWVEHNANSSITYDSGAAIISSNQYNEIRQVLSLVEGRRYRASMDVITRTSGSWFFLLAHDATSSFAQGAFGDGTTQTFDFTAGAVNTLRIYPYTTGNPDTIKVDNISVRELYPFEQYNPSEGTVVCDFDCVSANTKGPFHFYEGTGFRGWGIRVINDSGTIIDGISRDASGFNNASVSGVNVSNLTRAVASVNSSGHMVAGGSGNSGSNTGNTVSLPVDRLDIGSSNIGGSNTGTMSGHIRRLKYSTRFVTELEAKNLTDD
jgi:hypothetical protein